ncbi:MAG: DRTGG domain-containing protein [Chloroflexota bacterium]|nr:AAA family ATPase [Chloroflexota bacterium]
MVALYIVSTQEAAGKTTIAIGIGRQLIGEGRKVGFLRPLVGEKPPGSSASDALFAQQAFNLTENVALLSPPLGSGKALADKAREAYIEISQNKDVVIIEGYCGTKPGNDTSQAAYEIARALKAKVIIVEDYARGKSAPQYLDSYLGFGENLLGFILNKVPKQELKRTCEELISRFTGSEMRILGVLPEERALVAFTVGELVAQINGELLNNGEKSVELVENVMVGAMCVDSGLDYFGRKVNKAAVVRNDRPDMQMAALETATKCLVISGGGEPIDYVRFKADEKGVPIITTRNDTDTVIKHIEDLLDGTRFHQEKKLNRIAEILQPNLDFKAICTGLGLAS